jgi:hypothetical protein
VLLLKNGVYILGPGEEGELDGNERRVVEYNVVSVRVIAVGVSDLGCGWLKKGYALRIFVSFHSSVSVRESPELEMTEGLMKLSDLVD